MIKNKVKFEFRQIETSLIAFVSDIERKLQDIFEDLPVFLLHTGDTNYYLNTKFKEVQNNEIIEKVPRFVMTFDHYTEDRSEDTNAFNKFIYLFDDKNHICDVRRKQVTVDINYNFVSSNFLQALQHFEVMMSIFSRENAFSYEYAGNTYEAAYSNDTKDLRFPELDSGSRNFLVTNVINLQLQIFSPRINTIVPVEEYETTKFVFIGLSDDKNLVVDKIDNND